MKEIIPAVIGRNFTEVENKIRLLEGISKWAHLDIMDGTFTKEESWDVPDDLTTIDGLIKIEVHLMIKQPEKVLRAWADVADRILVHVEATDHLNEVIDFFTSHKIELGLAFNLATSLSTFESKINQADVVQLMAIAEIGEQGHPSDKRAIEKIKLLRQSYPSVKIQVDGGVTLDNVHSLIAAGADNLVVGSAIWRAPDPLEALRVFQSL